MNNFYILLIVALMASCKPSVNSKQDQIDTVKTLKKEMYATIVKIGNENSKTNPLQNIQRINIDCSKTDSLLSKAYETDQKSRQGIDTGIDDVDGENQQTIISIIENCGWPNSKINMDVIWIVLQHSNSELISLFYPKLKEAEQEGLIEPSKMALMEDRLLMFNGYPQVFGSQVRNGKLYNLKDSKNINEIRKSAGLEPIEDYTKRFGFEYKKEDYIE